MNDYIYEECPIWEYYDFSGKNYYPYSKNFGIGFTSGPGEEFAVQDAGKLVYAAGGYTTYYQTYAAYGKNELLVKMDVQFKSLYSTGDSSTRFYFVFGEDAP